MLVDFSVRLHSEIVDFLVTFASPYNLKFLKTYNWNWPDMNLIFEVYKIKIPKDTVNIVLDKNENTEFVWQKPEVLYKRNDLMKGLYLILKDEYSLE